MRDIFDSILQEINISEIQKNKYLCYINFLQKENKKYNLTRIDALDKILYYHILDTLLVTKFELFDAGDTIADIGSGCGVPGILLAIFYPNKKFYLVEVVKKKINFLNECIILLNLDNCIVINEDFLTFIRRKKSKINFFIGRASLGLSEFVKIYSIPLYNRSSIIYWAAPSWKFNEKHNSILKNNYIAISEYLYQIKEDNKIKNLSYVLIKKK